MTDSRFPQYDLKLRGAGSYSGERQSGKSELSVCNFVSDYNIFRCAKEDAKEILESPEEREKRRISFRPGQTEGNALELNRPIYSSNLIFCYHISCISFV